MTPVGLTPQSRGLAATTSASGVERLCQICGSADLYPGLDLGHQPVGDLILSGWRLQQPETLYPMQLFHCNDCGLCQLGYIVDAAIVYQDFPFVSGTTQTATRHLQGLAADLSARLGLGPGSFALDIGSNDGTLLAGYLPHNVRILGIDPSALPVEIARQRGIPTWHAFFNEETARMVLEESGPADAISAAGCFAHIADLVGVMKGVKLALKAGGIFCSDNQYWLDMVESLHYDNIFHQHLRNYSLKPLQHLFAQYGMEIVDVERWGVYGGSIRVFAAHEGDHPISPRVAELMEHEIRAGLYLPETAERFRQTTAGKRQKLFDEVYSLAREGKKVIGIGAPAKASTVCNFCRLGPDLIEYITEVNPLRIGKYLPGVHIPIIDEATMFTDPRPADAAILFAWNYYDEIVPKLRAKGYQGAFLEP